MLFKNINTYNYKFLKSLIFTTIVVVNMINLHYNDNKI